MVVGVAAGTVSGRFGRRRFNASKPGISVSCCDMVRFGGQCWKWRW